MPVFGRQLPDEVRIGESWEVVDRSHHQSVVARGPHAGQALHALLEGNPTAIMGPSWSAGHRFPILVKWLDCRERLSLQVHPPSAIAAQLGGEPKTENWYIARADQDASLIVGLRRGITRADFELGLATETLDSQVHRVRVQSGDSMFVPSGRVHAIEGGNLILEIQQNSDTTYRVYDWGRLGDDGRPRQLHVAESLRSIDFADVEPDVLRPPEHADVTLAECREFRIRRLFRPSGGVFAFAANAPEARLLSVVDGAVVVASGVGTEHYAAGDNVLIPADTRCDVSAERDATVLITDGFSRV
jgi:mannose-6-phosphate isomerase